MARIPITDDEELALFRVREILEVAGHDVVEATNGNEGIEAILLVEDDPRDELLTRRELQRHGLANDIVVAHDGAEAAEILFGDGGWATGEETKMPAVVMLDLKLPKLDGQQVLKSIRAEERTKTLPVVILTSFEEESDIIWEHEYEGGANGYICKPVRFDNFRATIKKLGLCWLLTNKPPPAA